MHIYLPIAEMPVNVLVLLALGAVTGILAGMFGVGGGFLVTPFLIFIGIPPDVAVSTSANQIIASSSSGFLAHLRRKNVDFKMGAYLLAGGMVGSTSGVQLFTALKETGQIDLVINLCYIVFLGGIGLFMGIESTRAIWQKRCDIPSAMPARYPTLQKLPWQTHFPTSNLTISLLLPLLIGFIVGMFVSLMGIGGGFILIPAMIYLLGMPTSVVIGTSLFQIIFITCNVTFLMAVKTQTVDIVLALLLIIGSVTGAQFGSKLGMKLPAEYLRGFLAAIVLGVAAKLTHGLFAAPSELFSLVDMGPVK